MPPVSVALSASYSIQYDVNKFRLYDPFVGHTLKLTKVA